MFANIPTWTTERVELLKGPFRRRPLLPRDCRRHRRQPQRRDRQAHPPRTDARTRNGRTAPGQDRPGAPRNPSPACNTGCCKTSTRTDSRRSRSRSPASAAARCSNSARNDAAGRSERPAPRIFAFAATRRSTACPIAPGTPASPTSPARASGSCVDECSAQPPADLFRKALEELRRIGLLRRLPHALVELVGVVADQDAPALSLDAVEDDFSRGRSRRRRLVAE